MKATKATRSARNKKLGIAPSRSGHTAKLRIDHFNAEMTRLNLTTNLDMARFLGLGEGTVSRLRAGKGSPGVAVIAAFVKKLPHIALSDLVDFGAEVAGDTTDLRAAA